MQNSWVSLIPPVIVIIAVLLTHNLNLSLAIGIGIALAVATNFSIVSSINLLVSHTQKVLADIDTIYLYTFLFILGAIIVLMHKTGGARAFAQRIVTQSPQKKSVERYSLLLSCILALDDYLSILTVGHVMQPITDRLGIAREKLAYLTHSMANSLILLIPISSWVTVLTKIIDQAGVSAPATVETKIIAEPFYMYFTTIPFIFYSLLTLLSVWIIIQSNLSFGPMASAEKMALAHAHPKEPNTSIKPHGTINNLIIPLTVLLGAVIIGTLWTGDCYLFGGEKSIFEAFKANPHLNFVLLIAGSLSLGTSLIYAHTQRLISRTTYSALATGSYELMGSALLLITLASILGQILQYDLQSGTYLATLILGNIPLYILPLLTFIIALILASITGSALGVIMLLFPIILPMLITLNGVTPPIAPDGVLLLMPTFGALLSGAVCGNHISPISDTTIMAATSSNISPITHARTQLPYTLPAILGTCCAFLMAGLLRMHSTPVILSSSLASGVSCCIILLYSLQWLDR